MRINSVNNVLTSKTNFGQLILRKDSDLDGDYIQDFVHNKEVLKFVKYYHEKGIDIEVDGHGKGGLALFGKNKNKENEFFYGIFGRKDELKNFNAQKAITEIAQTAKEKLESIPKLKEAEKFVEMFNTALKIFSDNATDTSAQTEEMITVEKLANP